MEILENYSYFTAISLKFTDEELAPIWSEVKEMQDLNFKGSLSHTHRLAGNIENSFVLRKSHSAIERLMLPAIQYHVQAFKYMEEMIIFSKDLPIVLDNVWVNFQKKHEFNPVHNHSGVFSFVIWLQLPFDIEEEYKAPFCKDVMFPQAGNFVFSYISQEQGIPKILHFHVPADKKYENQGFLFPSSVQHQVYPFSTSDDYRISVSGNFYFKV